MDVRQTVTANETGRMSWKDFVDRSLCCGQLSVDTNKQGCGAKDWHVVELNDKNVENVKVFTLKLIFSIAF